MADDRQPPAKKPWLRPAVVSLGLPQPTLLLACSANNPVDCFPLDGVHYCVKNACGCMNKPPHC